MDAVLRLCWSEDVAQVAIFLLGPLREALGCKVEWGEEFPSTLAEVHVGRRQVRAADLLRRLRPMRPSGGGLLVVIGADLYAPGLDYLFGEADPRGRCAVVSTARLREGGDAAVFHRRLLVEAVHESGHLLGLGHCRLRPCAMHFSVTVAEVDQKGEHFCPECRARIGRSG